MGDRHLNIAPASTAQRVVLPQTARLSLRRFTSDDAPLLYRLNSDPAVMRHLGGAMDEAANRTMLESRILKYYDEHPGYGVWATLKQGSDECIGFHLLNHVLGEPNMVQVGYRLFPQFWGQGYATEMTLALLHYGYTMLEESVLTAHAALDNIASQRVLEKAGLHRSGTRRFTHPMYAAIGEVAYFERRASDWLAQFPTK